MVELPGYYAVIPAPVRYDKRCSPSARLLYGEIAALANKEGYCWASNRYFAELYDVDDGTASAWVAQLVEAGHVRAEVEVDMGNRRKIWILSGQGVSGKSRRPRRQKPETSPAKAGDPSPGKAGDITPSPSTTMNGARTVTDLFWACYSDGVGSWKGTGTKPVYKAQYTDWAKRMWRSLGESERRARDVVESFFTGTWYFTKGGRFDFAALYQHWNEVVSACSARWKRDPPGRAEGTLSLLEMARSREREEVAHEG